MAGSETVWLVHKAKTDRLKPTSDTPTEFELKRCDVIPAASQESQRGWVQQSGYTVAVYENVEITADDQMRVRGDLYSVIGKPGYYFKRGKFKVILVTVARSA